MNHADDSTIILADMAEKAIRQVKATVNGLLLERMGAERAEQVASTLSTGVWTHDYPIDVDQARELGLPVSTDMPKEVYKLMGLYPQTAQRRPSVEYIPTPYRSPTERREHQPAQAEQKWEEGMPALIFDLDGTLIDMVYAHVFARQRALAEAGMAIDGWRIHAGALRVYRDPADLQRSLDELGIVP